MYSQALKYEDESEKRDGHLVYTSQTLDKSIKLYGMYDEKLQCKLNPSKIYASFLQVFADIIQNPTLHI